jgi:hypothetical protein
MATGFTLGRVEGVEEVHAALAKFAPELYDELKSKMRNAAEQIASAIDSAVPGSPPMSGFNHYGRTSWNAGKGPAIAVEETASMPYAGDWPVYRVMLTGAATVMTDIAGAGGGGMSPSGANMIGVLNQREGNASRWVWPVAKAAQGKVQSAMSAAADKAAETTTNKIKA